jgi:2-(3-amino-3-carboxypropyl)histidine synthase
MKILHIDAKSEVEVKLDEASLKKLPKKIGILTTIQHLHKINDVEKQIPNSILGGQVLGCDASAAKKIKDKVDAFLYIGSGDFHPIEIVTETGKEVFCFNPFTRQMKTIGKEAIEKHEKRKQGALIRFLSSEKIGILVSTKSGQNRMKDAVKLAEKKDKQYYIFAFDTLNIMDLENFPFIEAWVNTACPRIAEGKKGIINIEDLPK